MRAIRADARHQLGKIINDERHVRVAQDRRDTVRHLLDRTLVAALRAELHDVHAALAELRRHALQRILSNVAEIENPIEPRFCEPFASHLSVAHLPGCTTRPSTITYPPLGNFTSCPARK